MSGCIVITITIKLCFKYLSKEFLPYFEKWKESVACRPGFEDAEKNRMLLSQATLDGILITGIRYS